MKGGDVGHHGSPGPAPANCPFHGGTRAPTQRLAPLSGGSSHDGDRVATANVLIDAHGISRTPCLPQHDPAPTARRGQLHVARHAHRFNRDFLPGLPMAHTVAPDDLFNHRLGRALVPVLLRSFTNALANRVLRPAASRWRGGIRFPDGGIPRDDGIAWLGVWAQRADKRFIPTGETLENRIAEALQVRKRPGAAKASAVAKPAGDPQPFEAGEMIFYPTRVELEGVRICGDADSARIRKVLDELRHKDGRDRFVGYSGEELARRVGCSERGQNGVAEAVRDFRKNVTDVMLDEANVTVEARDVLQSGGRGYRLTDKITVKEGVDPVNDRVQVPADPQNDPDGDPLNERQEWIVEQLQGSAELRIGQVVDQWKCSKTTAKRDLTGLREQGLIEFEGAARTGSWRLKG